MHVFVQNYNFASLHALSTPSIGNKILLPVGAIRLRGWRTYKPLRREFPHLTCQCQVNLPRARLYLLAPTAFANANNHTVIGTKPRPSRAPLVLSSRSTPTATICYTPDQCDYIETISAWQILSDTLLHPLSSLSSPRHLVGHDRTFHEMLDELKSVVEVPFCRFAVEHYESHYKYMSCNVCHLKDYFARAHYLPTQGRLMVNLAKVVRILAVQLVWEEHGIHHASLHPRSFHPNRDCVDKFFLQTSIPPSAFRKQCQHSPSTISAA